MTLKTRIIYCLDVKDGRACVARSGPAARTYGCTTDAFWSVQ